MKRVALLLFSLGFLLLLVYLIFFSGRNPFRKKPAGLDITSSPSGSEVYLDGKVIGTTPLLLLDLAPGRYQLKLVPPGETSLSSWETTLTLTSSLSTVVHKDFALAESDSASYTLTLEKTPGHTYLSLVTDPATVNLTLDGKPSGYTPLTQSSVNPGTHHLSLTSPGYHPLELEINAIENYHLVVSAKLAAAPIILSSPSPASASAQPSPSPSSGPTVLIEETDTGWLRVRQEPSSSAIELGKVNVGERLPYLGETTDTGWHKVEFEGESGWISSRYAKLIR